MEELKGKKSRAAAILNPDTGADEAVNDKDEAADADAIDYSAIKKILYVCGNGVGTSAMGASIIAKKLKKSGIEDIAVPHARLGDRQPKDIAGLILYYPAFNMPGTADKYRGIDEIPEKSFAMDNLRVVGKAFYADMYGINPFDAAHEYEGDVLIVHGDRDTTVPFEWSKRAVSEYAHANLVKIPGASHGFQGEHQIMALQEVERYVWNHFGERP